MKLAAFKIEFIKTNLRGENCYKTFLRLRKKLARTYRPNTARHRGSYSHSSESAIPGPRQLWLWRPFPANMACGRGNGQHECDENMQP